MLWYLSNDSLLFQCFPLSTQMINSPPILESALVRIRISDLVHVLTQITVAASPILETAPATEFESCRFGDKPPTALGISCRLKTNSSGESFNKFCKKTPLKQKLSHHTGLSQSTSAVAIKFSWMSVTHFTAESLSTFQCSGSIWITVNMRQWGWSSRSRIMTLAGGWWWWVISRAFSWDHFSNSSQRSNNFARPRCL